MDVQRMAPFTTAKPVVSAPVSRTALRVEANRKVQKKQKVCRTHDGTIRSKALMFHEPFLHHSTCNLFLQKA